MSDSCTVAADPSGILSEVDILFPAPRGIEQVWVLESLIAILQAAPWLGPLVGGSDSALELAEQREQSLKALPPDHRYTSIELLTAEFGRAGAVVGRGAARSSRELSLVRGLYWLALRRWWIQGRLDHPAGEAFAAALRATARSLRSAARIALDPTLNAMKAVDDLPGAVAAMDLVSESNHQALRSAWGRELRQVLTDSTAAVAPTTTPAPLAQVLTPKPHPVRRNIDRLEALESLKHPTRVRLLRNIPAPEQLPTEPADEFSLPVDLVAVPGLGTGEVPSRYAIYQARQAVWGGNPLLLTSHVEALSGVAYGAAMRWLVMQLDRDDLTDELVTGMAICLLKAITGRTTSGIQSICSSLTASSTSPLRLDLNRGEITAPPYWRSDDFERTASSTALGYFQPTPAQSDHLEPASGLVSLPLPRPVHRVLRQRAAFLEAAAKVDPSQVDAMAAEAAARMATQLGIDATVATLRRCLGPQIAEVSGDLALAQLVCGDSFGSPSSQQHYYAPRRKDIAHAYAKAVAVHFDESTAPSLLRAGLRTGSQLLVTPSFARKLAQSSHDNPVDCEGTDALPQWLSDHRRQLDHCSRMVIATTGHRPTQSLFELTLYDFDLQAGVALYRDKRHDEAHDPRLVALPTVVCKQLSSFLRHLEQLATIVPTTRDAIGDALSGRRALLLDFDKDGNAARPTLAALKARSPAVWNELPWNWSRTYLRTRGIDMGGSAFALACQLGHFDAVGYPYCQQSPTVPLEIVLELRPVLDRLASAQGWTAIYDTQPVAKSCNDTKPVALPPPLHNWGSRLGEVEQAAAQKLNEWEHNLRRLARQDRNAALERVLQHPQLIATGVSTAYRVEKIAQMPAPLDETAVFSIRSDLAEEAGDDAPLALALLRALRHILRRVAQKTGQRYPTVPLPIFLRRPLDNPFFPGFCVALTQMRAMRDHLAVRSRVKRPKRTFLLQVARTAEALALFGHIECPDQLLATLEARHSAQPSAKIPDLLLVPLPNNTVVGLRGIAALALAALAQAHPDNPLPPRGSIVTALAEIVPRWAVENRPANEHKLAEGDLLDRLCSTTSVVNRYELSPAARFALDPHHGATHATIGEQLAFIDADMVAPLRQDTPSSPAASQPEKMVPSADLQRTGTAYRQYLAVCRAIPTPHKDLHLPLTGVQIPANAINHAPTREAVLAELDTHLNGSRLWPIVRMLTSWIRAEATRQAGTKGALADSTLSTYLTRIGRTLVQTLGSLEFSELDEDTLEDAFAFCLDASQDARHKVAAALLSFYSHCEARWDLPDLDLGFVYAELDRGRHAADASLILPFERDAALKHLDHAAWGQQATNFTTARQARLAQVVAYPIAWGGCRMNEALGLQARDIGTSPDGTLWTRVRSNRRRRLKTIAASRRVDYRSSEPEKRHRAHLLQRAEDVRRQADRRADSAYLIADIATGINRLNSDTITQIIRDALALATGRPSERLHRLRHLVANEAIRDVALCAQDREWLDLRPEPELNARTLTPRDFASVATALGHAHWRTTLQSYLHIPWMLQSRTAHYLRVVYFRRAYVAGALGYTPATLDWLLRDRKVDRIAAWFGYIRPGRVPPTVDTLPSVSTANTSAAKAVLPTEHTGGKPLDTNAADSAWTTVRLGGLVTLATKVRDLESAMRSVGAPMDDMMTLLEVAHRWELRLGLRVLPTHVGGVLRTGCPARAVRRLHTDLHLERMWIDFDDTDNDRRQLIDDFYTWLMPSKRHDIKLPINSVHVLEKWLGDIGIDPKQILKQDLGGGIIEVSVRRSEATTAHRYLGMGLRRIMVVIGMGMELRSLTLRTPCQSVNQSSPDSSSL